MNLKMWVVAGSLAISVGALGATSASAQEGMIEFRGDYVHQGAYVGKTVVVKCAVNKRGDTMVQTTRCEASVYERMREGGVERIFFAHDKRARIAVVDHTVFQLTLGLSPLPAGSAATSPLSTFHLTALYKSRLALTNGSETLPGTKNAPKPTLLTLTLNGIHQDDNPDCLIFDIVGGDVYDGAAL